MIQTWIADVSALLDKEKYEYYYKRLPDFRKAKADRIRFQEDKALSVGVWILLEKMRETYRLGEEAVYNLSHSGNYAMCAIDDSEMKDVKVGCDLERQKEAPLKIAKRYFCKNELSYIEKDENAFFRFWVLKESFMKATRRGMSLGLNTFAFEFDQDGVPFLLKQPKEITDTFYFKEYRWEKIPYKLAVCSTDNHFAEELRIIQL